jgi:hypothetical protein
MASLKPDAVAPVAMVGAEITWEGNKGVKLEGIFNEIRRKTLQNFRDFLKPRDEAEEGLYEKACKYEKNLDKCIDNIKSNGREIKLEEKLIAELEKQKKHIQNVINKFENKELDLKKLTAEEKLVVKELFGRLPVIVLDELNSLSLENQGTLLRILENAEITPIGGFEDKMGGKDEIENDYREFVTDFLVVGLMNEDPEEITREEAIRFLKRESYIGGFLGDMLYEHILKIRRLRPDLRSRMMRNGMFKVPRLSERRSDIPGMFYLLLNWAIGDYFVNTETRITIDALEYLMRPDFEWPENVRLLQTLVKKVVEIVYEDYENKRQMGHQISKIDGVRELYIVREKHLRQAMKEIGS